MIMKLLYHKAGRPLPRVGILWYRISMTRNPVYNAILAAGYITLVATLMTSMEKFDMPGETVLIPIAVLSLFVLSAALMGFIFFYHPVLMYLEGQKAAAVSLFLKTVAAFAVMTAIFFGVVIYNALAL